MKSVSSGTWRGWRVSGSCVEGCNCEASCPCRSVDEQPSGPSSFGECFGALSWQIARGHAEDVDLSGLASVLSIRYLDSVQPSTPVGGRCPRRRKRDRSPADGSGRHLLGRAEGTIADRYRPAIGEIHAIRPARINLEHVAARRRIDVAGYITVEAEEQVAAHGRVRCGIPGYDHPGTELRNDVAIPPTPYCGGRYEEPARRSQPTSTVGPTEPDPAPRA